MSVIENALDKFRRSVAQGGPQPLAPPREIGSRSPALPSASSSASDRAVRQIAVDWAGMRVAGYLPAVDMDHQFANYYRQIKRPLIERALAAGGASGERLILISSSLPGDGKTFTTINLALSMARERDISVLLIDGDVSRAQVTQTFGLRGEPGLMNALADESLDVESLIVRTDVQSLEILPAGGFLENATELMASARMTTIAARIAARNPRCIVLFDSPPLLGSSEARTLTRIPGQVVLVVRAGETPRQAVLDAIALIEREKFAGLILNQAPARKGDGYYYGYSSYGVIESETPGAG